MPLETVLEVLVFLFASIVSGYLYPSVVPDFDGTSLSYCPITVEVVKTSLPAGVCPSESDLEVCHGHVSGLVILLVQHPHPSSDGQPTASSS